MNTEQNNRGNGMMKNPPLGVIEGFYGPLWSWPSRRAVMERLSGHGFSFYYYAPKADPWLREQWYAPMPEGQAEALATFAKQCRDAGVRFGVGLSPVGALAAFDGPIQQALQQRLDFFDEIGVTDLAILFDDATVPVSDPAAAQVELVQWVRTHCKAERISVCPTYYSDDPMLDKLFGERPDDYLATLGQDLDADIEVFWAGEEICPRAFSPGHLDRVADILKRRPLLWDNYPVNDSEVMANHLHLRGFTGRPASLANHCSGHAINPALQPTLSCIPALTLADSYRQGEGYQYLESTLTAMAEVAGPALASQLFADLPVLQDAGLHAPAQEKLRLREAYEAWDHPVASEIVRWLRGEYGTESLGAPTG